MGIKRVGFIELFTLLSLVSCLILSVPIKAQIINTVAGGGVVVPEFNLVGPQAVAIDRDGNIYIADGPSSQIRKISSDGVLSTLAGTGIAGFSGDGKAYNMQINFPVGLVIDTTNGHNWLYFGDCYNHRIRKINLTDSIMTTIAGNGTSGYSGDGGKANNASFNFISALTIDQSGNLFIADSANYTVRKINFADSSINRIAGNRTFGNSLDMNIKATNASIGYPMGLAFDKNYNLYISDAANNVVWKIGSDSILNVYAGGNGWPLPPYGDGGLASQASLFFPTGLCFDNQGNLYIADTYNQRIRRVNTRDSITTVAGDGYLDPNRHGRYLGDGGVATTASLNYPLGLAISRTGTLYIADNANSRIRKVDNTGNINSITYIKINQQYYNANSLSLSSPTNVCAAGNGAFYFADAGQQIVFYITADGRVSVIAGNGLQGNKGNGIAVNSQLNNPHGICLDKSGKNLFIADTYNNVIKKVDKNGYITTVAGNGLAGYKGDGGLATAANLNLPYGISTDNNGNLFIADTYNNVIRKVDANGIISTIVGNGNAGFKGDSLNALNANLNQPMGVTTDNYGNLFIADTYNNRIRKVNNAGIITTVAGNGQPDSTGNGGLATLARLNQPTGVSLDSKGNLFIADKNNNEIREISAANNLISTVAGDGFTDIVGNGRFQGDNGIATLASIFSPFGICIDTTISPNNLLIADKNNKRIREVFFQNCIPTNAFPVIDQFPTPIYKPNIVNLNWHTTTDASINNYIIQRSTDAINFNTIDNITSLYGNSGGRYSYADTLNIPDLTLYYRLAYKNTSCSVDTLIYSKTVVVYQTTTQKLSTQDSLYVYNGMLYNQCGDSIILRGVNYSAMADYYFANPNRSNAHQQSDDIINYSGANAVRIQWFADMNIRQSWGKTPATISDLDKLITTFETNGIIPIVELYDLSARGIYNDTTEFKNKILNWWTSPTVVSLTKKHIHSLIINLANEFGYVKDGNNDPTGYLSIYTSAIKTIRDAGIHVPIMIDAPDAGQNLNIILANGSQLLNADILGNTIFSIHSYWNDYPNGMGGNLMIDQLNSIPNASLNNKLPIVFGEIANYQSYGASQACDATLPLRNYLSTMKNNNLGWLAWTWNDDNCNKRRLAEYDGNGNLVSIPTDSLDQLSYYNTIINAIPFGLNSNSGISKQYKYTCTFTTPVLPVCTPPTITSFTTQYIFNHKVLINWTSSNNTNIGFYSLLRSGDGQHFKSIHNFPVSQNPSTSFTYTDSLFTNQGQYYYQIAITDSASPCSLATYSAINSITELPCNTYPLQDFTVIRTDTNTVHLSFNTISDANIGAFYLQKSANDTSFKTINTIAAQSKYGSSSYLFNDKLNSSQGVYQYRVVFTDTSSKCLDTNYTKNVIVYPMPCSLLPPPDITATYNKNATATINFTTVTDGNIGYYILQRKADINTDFVVIDTIKSQYSFDGGFYTYTDTLSTIKIGTVSYRLSFMDTVCGTVRDTTINFTIPCSFVPMDNFTATCNDFYVNLNWQTYPNENVANYTLQRSMDGYNFTNIQSIANHDLDSSTYAYIDKYLDTTTQVGIGGFFYRLYYKDTKCNIEGYSDTIFLDPTNCILPQLLLYPNPANNLITLAQIPRNTIVGIYSINGKIVMQKQSTERGDFHIDISSLKPGIYCVRCASVWSPTQSGIFIKL